MDEYQLKSQAQWKAATFNLNTEPNLVLESKMGGKSNSSTALGLTGDRDGCAYKNQCMNGKWVLHYLLLGKNS